MVIAVNGAVTETHAAAVAWETAGTKKLFQLSRGKNKRKERTIQSLARGFDARHGLVYR
jgi:hypothetical protein